MPMTMLNSAIHMVPVLLVAPTQAGSLAVATRQLGVTFRSERKMRTDLVEKFLAEPIKFEQHLDAKRDRRA